MSRLRRAAKVVAIGTPGAIGCGALAYRWKNRPDIPPHQLQSLQGRSIVLTGGTSGIGRATLEGLLQLDAHVVVGTRDAARGQALLDALGSKGGTLEVLPLDLQDPKSVGAFAAEARKRIAARTSGLHAFVNSAAEIRCGPEWTPGGLDATFATNHLGPQQLLELLLGDLASTAEVLQQANAGGTLDEARRPRIVLLGSKLERRGTVDLESLESGGAPDPAMAVHFDPMRNYGASKLANMYLAAELRKRLDGLPIDVLVVSPGMVNTELWSHFPLWYRVLTKPVRVLALRSPAEAAEGVLFAIAAREAEGRVGYFCDGRPLMASEASKDAVAACRLFELCRRLTNREWEARELLQPVDPV